MSLALIAAVVPGSSPGQSFRRFDIPGAMLLMAGALGLLLPLGEGSTWGWASARTIGLFIAGAALLLIWGWWELRCADPLIDLRPFRSVHFLLPDAVCVLIAGPLVGLMAYREGARRALRPDSLSPSGP